MDTEDAAEAILAIGLAHMVRAVRKVSVERGLDPREFTLVPFGGAGPLHAGLLLRHLGLRSVLVPSRPGLFSADGLLVAGLRLDDAQTVLMPFGQDTIAVIGEWFRGAGRATAEQIVADDVSIADVTVTASADCRYIGQGFEINVPLDGWEDAELQRIPERFHVAHEELYGHANRDEPIEVVTLRVAAAGAHRRSEPSEAEDRGGGASDALLARRVVRIPGFAAQEVPFYERSLLRQGDTLDGPAIIAQMDSTTVLCSGQRAVVTTGGDLVITEGPGA